MATIFKTINREVKSAQDVWHTATVPFTEKISNATVTTQGFSIEYPGNGGYRGTCRLRIKDINFTSGKSVEFKFLLDFAEGKNNHWPMDGSIDFLIIAITD